LLNAGALIAPGPKQRKARSVSGPFEARLDAQPYLHSMRFNPDHPTEDPQVILLIEGNGPDDVRDLGLEVGMKCPVHDGEAVDRAGPGDRYRLKDWRLATYASRARRMSDVAAECALLEHQFPARCAIPVGGLVDARNWTWRVGGELTE
jgi:hypothetical protein